MNLSAPKFPQKHTARVPATLTLAWAVFLPGPSVFAQGAEPGASAADSTPETLSDRAADSRVKPLRSGFRLLESRAFGLGVYRERTQYRTRGKYEPDGFGTSLSFDQHIRGPWGGGVLLRWSRWRPQRNALGGDEDEQLESVAPLTAFSRVHFSPRLPTLWGSAFDNRVRFVASGGIGYLAFMKDRPTYKKSAQEPSETVATYGAGVRFVWPGHGSLKLTFDRWRGLRSFRYSAVAWQCEVQFGDVDAL